MKNPEAPVPLTTLSCLKIHGSDARSFLQSQLTIDIRKLEPGESRLGAYCEPTGRVISTFILALIDEIFYMLVPASLEETIKSTLLRYRIRAKVKFDSPTEAAVHGCYLNEENSTACSSIQQVEFAHPLDLQRKFILQPAANTEDTDSFRETKDWALADINSGMVWLDQHTTTSHLPQSLGLVANNAVDFDKGCYPGQEIIARLKYLGKSKYTLRRFEAEIESLKTTTAADLRDSSGKRQGQCLNSISHGQKSTGLVVVSKAAITAGKELYFIDENSMVLGKIVEFNNFF